LRALGQGASVDDVVTLALGVALLVAALALIVKAYLSLDRRTALRSSGRSAAPEPGSALHIAVRPLPTVLIGAGGGLIVGMTSVGSGSIMIIALMLLYAKLQASQLVGTDLVQAVPLVASAALGHLIFGDFQLAVAVPLLVGSIPGAVLGALVSSRAPGGLVRRALALVLLASGLKLLGVSTPVTATVLAACLMLGPLAWMAARRRHGLPAAPLVSKKLRNRRATFRAPPTLHDAGHSAPSRIANHRQVEPPVRHASVRRPARRVRVRTSSTGGGDSG